jgi:hypothetical protein
MKTIVQAIEAHQPPIIIKKDPHPQPSSVRDEKDVLSHEMDFC